VPREAPVPAAPQQEHRTVAPHEAPQGPVLQQERGNGSDRGNGNDRRHDQP
jgi:hypothetical protein